MASQLPLEGDIVTHEERQRLIRTPIMFHVHPPAPHAGTLIERELPESGRRRPHGRSPDESFYSASQNYDDLIQQLTED